MNCPEGSRAVDLDVMRRAMTRMLVSGELHDQPMADLAQKAGMSRSTVSRIFSGRPASLKRLLALLTVLGLAFDDVVAEAVASAEEPGQAAGEVRRG